MSRFVAVLFLALSASNAASAAVLDFEDVVSGGHYDRQLGNSYAVSDGYGGLNWDNVWVLDAGKHHTNTGYGRGRTSGDHVAFNGYGWSASAGGSAFDFNGLFLTSAWYNDNQVTLSGYNGGALTHSQTVTVDTAAPSWFQFDFFDIDQLTISTSRGQVAFDDFTFNRGGTPVPELDPDHGTSALLLALGGLAVALGGRRHRI